MLLKNNSSLTQTLLTARDLTAEDLTAEALTADDLKEIPQDWLDALHQAAALCDDNIMHWLLQQIPSDYAALSHKLERLIYNFSFQQIRHLTEVNLQGQY